MGMICLRTGEPATADIVEKYCVEVGVGVVEHSGGVSNGVVEMICLQMNRRGSHC